MFWERLEQPPSIVKSIRKHRHEIADTAKKQRNNRPYPMWKTHESCYSAGKPFTQANDHLKSLRRSFAITLL